MWQLQRDAWTHVLQGQSSDNAISPHLYFLHKCLCYFTGVELELEPAKQHWAVWVPHPKRHPVLGIHRLEVELGCAALTLLRMAHLPGRPVRGFCGGTPRIPRHVNVLLPQ